MIREHKSSRVILLEIGTAFLFAVSIGLNLSCDTSEGPDLSKCGSGSVYLDTKTDLCKDRADNSIVPRECCN
jgi:hypothetical protein